MIRRRGEKVLGRTFPEWWVVTRSFLLLSNHVVVICMTDVLNHDTPPYRRPHWFSTKLSPILVIPLNFRQFWWQKKPKSKEIIVTRIGDIFFTQKLTNFFKSLEFSLKLVTKRTQNRKELLSPELVIFLSLKNSPISSNHRNFHQNWWQKNPKIGRNYCHQNWWHFRHSKTHQFLQFTKNVTKIGEKFGENSIENSNHQNFHQNWWKFWRKFNRKWMWAPTSCAS